MTASTTAVVALTVPAGADAETIFFRVNDFFPEFPDANPTVYADVHHYLSGSPESESSGPWDHTNPSRIILTMTVPAGIDTSDIAGQFDDLFRIGRITPDATVYASEADARQDIADGRTL